MSHKFSTYLLAGVDNEAFISAKREQAFIESKVEEAERVLEMFPTLVGGLVEERIRISPEYQAANNAYKKAFAKLQQFNSIFVKRFAKELREERAARWR